ncbi:MAG: EVE domain-containing protein [Sphingomonadales bacterium]|nr:EVE domain-containing protein [Sphingomonadales bacterium]
MSKIRYWLMKSEPDAYSWDDLVAEGEGRWDGVRNAQAANFMREMSVGDRVLFYHSITGKEAVGIMEVSKPAYPDPTAEQPDKWPDKWVAVSVRPVTKLKRPVTLAQMKADDRLSEMKMLRQSRLSVCPLTTREWQAVTAMAEQG